MDAFLEQTYVASGSTRSKLSIGLPNGYQINATIALTLFIYLIASSGFDS